jgi:hypothetical protein
MRMLYLRVAPADLEELERDPDVAGTWFADRDDVLDLGSTWHAIHFLLNGTAWGGTPPFDVAVLGGQAIGEPTTYEPIRFVSPDRVATLRSELPRSEDLVLRFTHKRMRQAEIYPDGEWDQPDVLTAVILPAYAQLVQLFIAAAADGDAVLITLDRS